MMVVKRAHPQFLRNRRGYKIETSRALLKSAMRVKGTVLFRYPLPSTLIRIPKKSCCSNF
jgi:hypothetical protein